MTTTATMTTPSLAMPASSLKKDLSNGSSAVHTKKSEPQSEPKLAPLGDWSNDLGFEGGQDCRSPRELKVTGDIPAYAAGTLYRTGPGGYKVDTDKGTTHKTSHWFDGYSQVHRFEIQAPRKTTTDGTAPKARVMYNSRTNVDKLIDSIRRTGSMEKVSFAQKRDPCESYFKKVMSVFKPAEPGLREHENVGVTLSVNLPGLPSSKDADEKKGTHASGITSLWAKTDAAHMKRIDPETLEPIGFARQQRLHPDLKGIMSAAHAKSDPDTGDVYNFNLDLGRRSTYRIFRVNAATGTTDILATIPSAAGSYIHSMFLSENHVILCVWQGYFAYGGLKILWERNILDSLLPFDPSRMAQWFVVDRRHGRGVVASYESDAFFAFHTINAWEAPSASDPSATDIVAEVAIYEDLSVLKRFYYDNLMSTAPGATAFQGDKGASARAVLRRYRLPAINAPLSSPKRRAHVDFSIPRAASLELPTLNPNYVTKPHRYTYGVADRGLSTFMDGIAKFDSATRETVFWSEHAQSPGEPIFVADPEDGGAEDAGVLLSVVLDGVRGGSYLLCLDARTLTELGRAEVGGVVGFGFHGTFVGSSGGALDM